jgi:hypothetical protein
MVKQLFGSVEGSRSWEGRSTDASTRRRVEWLALILAPERTLDMPQTTRPSALMHPRFAKQSNALDLPSYT